MRMRTVCTCGLIGWAAIVGVATTTGCAGMIKDGMRQGTEEIWNEKKVDKIDEGFAPAAAKAARSFAEKTFAMFPDFKVELREMAVDGDHVFARWAATGTHKKLGKKITIHGITYSKLDGRKVVEQQVVWNELDELRQLGYKIVTPAGETQEIKLFVEP